MLHVKKLLEKLKILTIGNMMAIRYFKWRKWNRNK